MNEYKILTQEEAEAIGDVLGGGTVITGVIGQYGGKYSLGIEGKEFINDDFAIMADNTIIAGWQMCTLPGCCGVCVSFHAWVSVHHRGLGIGTILNNVRQRIAKEAGYGLLLCTDNLNNVAQQKILDANGWESLTQFINPRTGNELELRVVPL